MIGGWRSSSGFSSGTPRGANGRRRSTTEADLRRPMRGLRRYLVSESGAVEGRLNLRPFPTTQFWALPSKSNRPPSSRLFSPLDGWACTPYPEFRPGTAVALFSRRVLLRVLALRVAVSHRARPWGIAAHFRSGARRCRGPLLLSFERPLFLDRVLAIPFRLRLLSLRDGAHRRPR
jgi:hypothetical protein